MEFRLLGPVEAALDGRPMDLGGARLPALLAVLLLHPNRTVAAERLARGIWPQQPQSAGANIRSYVAQLRAAFAAAGEPRSRVVTESTGYRMAVGPEELDLWCFEDLAAEGAAALERGDPAAAMDCLRQAADLWRGDALAGLAGGPLLRAEAARLDERRMVVFERWADAALAAGRHDEATAELARQVGLQPLREGLRARLMLALYRAGRQGDALRAYQEAYRVSADELGVVPGDRLQGLHRQILDADPALHPASGPPVAVLATDPLPTPRQLPAAVGAFTGRESQLAQLDALCADRSGVLPVCLITGTAGVGKTALAVHWAHRVADQFPDGQLYLDLRGYAPAPAVTAGDAIATFLRALGVPTDQLPTGETEAAARYRSLLAGHRILVVLDNAASADQVRPLLPGSGTCAAIVTSRELLPGLVAREGAARLRLDVLAEAEAVALLTGLLGEGAGTEVAELALLCAYLPLALRIAAANVADRSLAEFLSRFTPEHRLTALAVDADPHAAVRSAFALSYGRLEPLPRRLFRLLGLPAGPDIDLHAAARLLDVSESVAAAGLAVLIRAHLVEEYGSGRYRMHDLLRLFARERAMAELNHAGRARALHRLATSYVDSAVRAHCLAFPALMEKGAAAAPFPSGADSAAAWFTAERANILATVRLAVSDPDLRDLLPPLVLAIAQFVESDRYDSDWPDLVRAALDAARATGDTHTTGRLLQRYGRVLAGRGDLDAAARVFAEATATAAGHPRTEVTARINQAVLLHQAGRLTEAFRHYESSLEFARALGEHRLEGYALANLAAAHRDFGRYAAAVKHASAARRVFRDLGDWLGEADALDDLGESYRAGGHAAEAIRTHREAIDLIAGRDLRREGLARWHLGEDLLAARAPDEAIEALRLGVSLLERADAAEAAAARAALARALARAGRPGKLD